MPASPQASRTATVSTAGDGRRSHGFVLLLFLVAAVVLALVIRPYAGAFFAAAVLGGVLYPLQVRLTEQLRDRARLAAGLLTATVVLVLVIPVGIVTTLVVRQAVEVAQRVVETYEASGVEGLVEPLPSGLRGPAMHALEALPLGLLQGRPAGERAEPGEEPGAEAPGAETPDGVPRLGSAASAAGSALKRGADFSVRTGLFVLALFFFLSEGRRLVEYLLQLVPLEDERARELLTSFRGVSVGVIYSALATAGAQTAVALVGYLIAGVPFLSLVVAATFVLAFVPAVGGAGVCTATGIVVWLSGDTWQGVFLTLWGVLVVSLIDNFVKPYVARGRAHLPGSLVFFAMICGLAVFGPMGLVAGPMAVALFQVSARMLRDDRAAGR